MSTLISPTTAAHTPDPSDDVELAAGETAIFFLTNGTGGYVDGEATILIKSDDGDYYAFPQSHLNRQNSGIRVPGPGTFNAEKRPTELATGVEVIGP